MTEQQNNSDIKRRQTANIIIKVSQAMGYLLFMLSISTVVFFGWGWKFVILATVAFVWGLMALFAVPNFMRQVIAE